MTGLEARLRTRIDAGGSALVPYVTGGLPGVDAALLRELEEAGADAVEIGVPFSDPVMDGPVIQEASQRALADGATPESVLTMIEGAGIAAPVVMTYYNPVLAIGEDAFVASAVRAGLAGVIVPDLPVDEGGAWRTRALAAGVAPVFLAAPGTDEARLKLVADASEGFVYCVSTYGVTGARGTLEGTARAVVEALRPMTGKPLLVGVGISTPDQAKRAAEFADGVVVGSAIVQHLLDDDRTAAVRLVEQLRSALS
ncbi:MAG: tryptophan synthase subunit alpha [Actinomycetota bacterium]